MFVFFFVRKDHWCKSRLCTPRLVRLWAEIRFRGWECDFRTPETFPIDWCKSRFCTPHLVRLWAEIRNRGWVCQPPGHSRHCSVCCATCAVCRHYGVFCTIDIAVFAKHTACFAQQALPKYVSEVGNAIFGLLRRSRSIGSSLVVPVVQHMLSRPCRGFPLWVPQVRQKSILQN